MGTRQTADIFNRLAEKHGEHGERFLPPQIIVDLAKIGGRFY